MTKPVTLSFQGCFFSVMFSVYHQHYTSCNLVTYYSHFDVDLFLVFSIFVLSAFLSLGFCLPLSLKYIPL